MLAKAILILTLVMSLFCSTQVFPVTSPSEMTEGGCARVGCTKGCCANEACCAATEEHRTPKPIQETSRPDLQLAAIRLRDFAPIYFLPPAPASFVFHEAALAGHTPPLLAVTCIRLI